MSFYEAKEAAAREIKRLLRIALEAKTIMFDAIKEHNIAFEDFVYFVWGSGGFGRIGDRVRISEKDLAQYLDLVATLKMWLDPVREELCDDDVDAFAATLKEVESLIYAFSWTSSMLPEPLLEIFMRSLREVEKVKGEEDEAAESE